MYIHALYKIYKKEYKSYATFVKSYKIHLKHNSGILVPSMLPKKPQLKLFSDYDKLKSTIMLSNQLRVHWNKIRDMIYFDDNYRVVEKRIKKEFLNIK